MKNCWKILDIEETTDVDIIRRAYLALLPSFHPETDPQGFKIPRRSRCAGSSPAPGTMGKIRIKSKQ